MKVAKLNSRNRHAGPKPITELKLNLGSGPNKMPGFVSVDRIAFPGVDVVVDLVKKKPTVKYLGEENKEQAVSYVSWPWPDSSVSEVHCSHTLEHFDAMERVHFMNELFRVLKPGAKATVITPHWASCRAYGDPTHKWPPVSDFYWMYLRKEWRMSQAPHTDASNLPGGFSCDFQVVWGYSLHPEIAPRNQEYQQYAMNFLKEACQDTIATLTKPCK